MHKENLTRYAIYLSGMIILALGITLNTKTDLGVSPLISMPFAVSQIWHINFALLAFIMYSFFTLLEIFLKGKNREAKDLLQLPFSLVFSLLLQFLGDGYDSLAGVIDILNMQTLAPRIIMLIIGVALTGIGVSMTVNMKFIPNPADGLAKAVGDKCGRNLGFGKNLIDISSVRITCIIGLLSSGHLVGVGIGTIVAMIGVGRCIFGFNYFLKNKMLSATGLAGSTAA